LEEHLLQTRAQARDFVFIAGVRGAKAVNLKKRGKKDFGISEQNRKRKTTFFKVSVMKIK